MSSEIITVTKITNGEVDYSGSSYVAGTNVNQFPHYPKVGEKFILELDFIHHPVIKEMEDIKG